MKLKRELSLGDTEEVIRSFKDTLADLSTAVCQNLPAKLEKVAQLIQHIKSTISDQGPTCGTFNRQLKAMREEFLPKIVPYWRNLGTEN